MSDLDTTTEKAANYSARAGEVIAGNLARGASGQFTSAGNASASKKPAQSYGAKRAARANATAARIAARRSAAAKPKGGKGKGKPKAAAKPNAAKPKGGAAAQRAAEAAKRRQARQAEAVRRKAEQAAKKIQRDQERAAAQAKRTADREAAKITRAQERAKRVALAEQRRAAKGGGGKGGKAKPKAAPDKSAKLAANRAAVQAATLDKPTFDALQSLVSGKQPTPGPAVDALLTSGLAERDTAGTIRISQAGRAYTNAADQGDIGRAKDAMSRARDRVAARAAVAARRTPRRDAPVKGATTKEYQPDRVIDAGHTGVMVYLPLADDVTAALAALDGVTEPAAEMHITLAYLGNSQETPLSTNKDRVIGAVAEWAAQQLGTVTGTINGAGRFMTVEDNETNAVYVSPDLAKLPALRQSLVEWLHTAGFDVANNHGYTPHITVAYIPIDAPTPDIRPADINLVIDAVCVAWGDEHYTFPFPTPATKEAATSCIVIKQANGRYRWIGVSSTAYQDRDGQYVSLKALQDDVARADGDGRYGPLRFWHMPGVDIGTTDYNAVVGRSLVESGEITDPRIGAALAASKERWQMSLGFLHGRDQPQGDTFTSIRRFERSILPASAASNPFTSLLVYKGDTMATPTEDKLAKLKELVGDDLLAQLLAGVEQTEKAADAGGVQFKETGADMEEKAADGAMVGMEAEGEAADTAEDAAEGESILTQVEIDAIAAAVYDKLAPLLSAATTKAAQADPAADLIDRFLGVVSKVEKEAQGASAKADQAQAAADAKAGEIAALKQRLATLEGDQPAGAGYRASAAADTVTEKQRKGPMGADAFLAAADFLIS